MPVTHAVVPPGTLAAFSSGNRWGTVTPSRIAHPTTEPRPSAEQMKPIVPNDQQRHEYLRTLWGREGSLGRARYDELCEGMRLVDDDPSTTVSHARMHQLVARKPALAG